MSYLSCKSSNMAINMWKQHAIHMIDLKYKNKNFKQKQYELDTYGKTYRNVIEGHMKEIMDICNTGNVGTLHQQLVQNDWGKLQKEVLNYRANLPTYKINTPIYIKNDNYTLNFKNGYYVSLSLFSQKGLKQINQKKGYQIEFKIDKMSSSQKSIINNILNGVYKQGSSQLQISKKGKVEFSISFSFEPEVRQVDINKVLGVDLGIVNTATMQVFDTNTQTWDRLSWKECMINGKELIHYRQKIEARNKQLFIASKIVGDGRIGHGRKTRLKPIEHMRDKVGKFRDTYNHKVSKNIIDIAVKNNCGTVQMENLSGYSGQQTETFLKNWSYYDLQNKTKYKCEEKGIKFILIDPKYTSKRCSACGCIDDENRDCKTNQAKFECVKCGFKENADVNAARNISIPYIDTIIEEELKRMGKKRELDIVAV